jgi:hypothetical protein
VPRVVGVFAATSIPPHPETFYDKGPFSPSGAGKLRKQGKIRLFGRGRGARWEIIPQLGASSLHRNFLVVISRVVFLCGMWF